METQVRTLKLQWQVFLSSLMPFHLPEVQDTILANTDEFKALFGHPGESAQAESTGGAVVTSTLHRGTRQWMTVTPSSTMLSFIQKG